MFWKANKGIKKLLKESPNPTSFQWEKTKSILLFYDIEYSNQIVYIVKYLRSIGKDVYPYTLSVQEEESPKEIQGTVVCLNTQRRSGWNVKKLFSLCTESLPKKEFDLLIDLSSKEEVLFPMIAVQIHPMLRCGINSPRRYFYDILINLNNQQIYISNLSAQMISISEKTERSVR